MQKWKTMNRQKKYLNKGLELSKKKNSPQALAVITLNLAVNAQFQKKLDKAVTLYQEVIDISEKNDLHRLELMARMNIGSVYIDAKRYGEAELIYGLALHDAMNLGLLDAQLNIYENLKESAINQGNYKNAFGFISKYFVIKDSIAKTTERQRNQ